MSISFSFLFFVVVIITVAFVPGSPKLVFLVSDGVWCHGFFGSLLCLTFGCFLGKCAKEPVVPKFWSSSGNSDSLTVAPAHCHDHEEAETRSHGRRAPAPVPSSLAGLTCCFGRSEWSSILGVGGWGGAPEPRTSSSLGASTVGVALCPPQGMAPKQLLLVVEWSVGGGGRVGG